MVTLKKKHFNGGKCVYGFGWISNGAWMIRQECVANGILFGCDPGVVNMALGLKGLGEAKTFQSGDMPAKALRGATVLKRLRVSGVLVEGEVCALANSVVARLAFSDDGDVVAYNDEFCKVLGVECGSEIYGKVDGPAISSEKPSDATWMLMPMRIERELLISQLGMPFIQSVTANTAKRKKGS